MMRVLGEICLLVSLVATGYAALLSVIRESDGRQMRRRVALSAALVGFAALTIVMVVLALALLWRDFRFEYVTQYASRLLPWQYCLSALWVGQAGSLLLWAWMMAVVAILLRILPAVDTDLRNTAFGLVMANVCFLVAVMVLAADPMAPNPVAADEGAGLSPLLQHPSMLIHPPIVFMAYATWTVPCALALAALWHGRLDAAWIQIARPWALSAWTLLGAGLLWGAHWAYQELGWGGYWGWDPVENGSLLPWLTGTGFIHSMLAWRHRGCLKKTAVSLAIVSFALCNFATFLTRSGIFSSVHAFSESPIGWMFLVLMIGVVVGGGALIIRRRAALGSPWLPSSVLARECLVSASIFLLLLLTTVVMVGTLVAPLSKMFSGRTIQVGPAFYNYVFAPIGMMLLAMTAAVPLLQWGAPPKTRERRLLAACLAVSIFFATAAFALGARHPLTVAVLALAALTVTAPAAAWLHEALRRDTRFRWQSLATVLGNGRRKYAAYAIHIGIACVAIGITGSSLGTERREVELSEGNTLRWAGRDIHYVRLVQSQLPDKLVAEAVLEVSAGSGPPVELRPARHLHLLQNEWTTEVAVHSSWSGDFYTVLHAGLGDGRVTMTLVNNPMVRWIWIGGMLTTVSAVVAIWPSRLRRHVAIDTTHKAFVSDNAHPTASAA
jgi:cytochrome c-type biogenesis protein CcmF